MVTLDEYLEAEHAVDAQEYRLGWRIHATVYAVVMAGLITLNLVFAANTGQDFLWFFFPLVGWGIGLTAHYLFAVRWADRQISTHQSKVEQAAERRLTV
jgi:hypothetical protein